MRYLIALWVSPLVLFWGWYFLSLNDINFGYVILSRRLHDLLFQLYGEMLGIDPTTIPGLLARACAFDSFLVAGLIAFRNRKAIIAWCRVQSTSAISAKVRRRAPEAGRARLAG